MTELKKVETDARCVICGSKGDWSDVDHLRMKPEGMAVCNNCGFVSYPKRIGKPENLRDYYETDYRKCPNVTNLYTGERKLHYHAAFLGETLKELQKIDTPKIYEEGAAMGMFLQWIRGRLKGNCEVSGSEWTRTFRRAAFHEYGIDLGVEFPEGEKFDMISTYKVAEHQIDVDRVLCKYREALNDGGYLYISVPQWHHMMYNFGVGGWDIEYYYHPDHINVWSRDHFEYLLGKCGFNIVQENFTFYDATYLCRVKDQSERQDTFNVNPFPGGKDKVVEIMESVKKANDCFVDSDYKGALEAFSSFPLAWQGHFEINRKMFHEKGFPFIAEHVLEKAMESCPNSADIMEWGAEVCLRYEQYDKVSGAINKILEMRPNGAKALMLAGQLYRDLATKTSDDKEKVEAFKKASEAMRHLQATSQQAAGDAISWRLFDYAHIPKDGETAQADAR